MLLEGAVAFSVDDCQNITQQEWKSQLTGFETIRNNTSGSQDHGSGTNSRLFCHFPGISSF